MQILQKLSDEAYVLLRVGAGAMFAFHGVQKVLGVLAKFQPAVGSQLWIGGVIELVGGVLIVIGLQTRLAAFVCSGTMAVAYTQYHWKFEMGSKFFPAINEGELALVYCLVFFLIACKGAGKWGIDKK